MRVLTFTSLFPNSLQSHKGIFVKQRMAAVRDAMGVDLRVVAPVPFFPNLPGPKHWRLNSQIPRQEAIDGIETYHPRYIVTPKVGMTLYGFSMFLGALPTVKRLHREFPFDMIDAHYVYPDGLAALLFGRFFNKPVVVSARGTDINLYPQLPWVGGLVKKVVQNADQLVSVSGSLKDIMVSLGAARDKVKVIPNGIDPNRFYPVDKTIARQILGLSATGKVLISVGALVERKGMHLLIDALGLLNKQGQLNCTTFILGEGEMRPELESSILRHGLNEKVVLVGEVPNQQLVNWYNAADLFFLGSSREGWPNVVCEALACGTPVVATPVNGTPEILSSDRLGIMVERNPENFSRGIIEALGREWDCDFIQNQGRSRTWASVSREVHSLFASLMPL